MGASTQTLYELADAFRVIERIIDEQADGEITPEIAASIDALSMDFAAKADNCCRFRQSILSEACAVQAEIDRLQARHASLTRRADWLKTYIFRSMQAAGQERIKTPLFTLWIQKSPPSASLAAGAEVPEKYRRIRVEFDGKSAIEDWKALVTLPPEVTVTQGEHLRIK